MDRKKTLLAEVQRQDAEFDAKVSLARQSHLDDENMQSFPLDADDTADDLAPADMDREAGKPTFGESGITSPVDGKCFHDSSMSLKLTESTSPSRWQFRPSR